MKNDTLRKLIKIKTSASDLKLMAINNPWDDEMLEREHDTTHVEHQYHKAANAK